MPYIGNPPADRYSKLAKQDVTGDGTVGPYTLDYAVGSVAEIEVFVNNVRQEPTTAYTVSGDQLTMTGTVASTDDFYVVFQGKAIASGQVPEKQSDGSYVYLGNVDINGNDLILDADADSKIEASTDDTINIISGGTTGLTVNSSGYVLKPQLPAFHVYRSAASAEGVTGTIDFNTVRFNNGSHYDTTNNYFVAPVDGVYTFSFSGLGASNTSGDALTAGTPAQSEIQYSTDSGSSYTGFAFSYSSSGQYPNISCSGVIELNSGDYVRVQMIINYVYVSNNAVYDPKFSGALIG